MCGMLATAKGASPAIRLCLTEFPGVDIVDIDDTQATLAGWYSEVQLW